MQKICKQGKKSALVLIPIVMSLLLLTTSIYAQQKAVTDKGQVVILNDDGTWAFQDKQDNFTDNILLNPTVFNRPDNASFEIKSSVNHSSFFIDPSLWTFKKANDSSASEYEFRLKDSDLYALAITEKVEIDLETLADIAFENAAEAATNAKIIKKEYREVNGKKLIYMQMRGSIRGIDFTYAGYYYSDAHGSTQFLTYTSSSLFKDYEQQIVAFLNGLAQQSIG